MARLKRVLVRIDQWRLGRWRSAYAGLFAADRSAECSCLDLKRLPERHRPGSNKVFSVLPKKALPAEREDRNGCLGPRTAAFRRLHSK